MSQNVSNEISEARATWRPLMERISSPTCSKKHINNQHCVSTSLDYVTKSKIVQKRIVMPKPLAWMAFANLFCFDKFWQISFHCTRSASTPAFAAALVAVKALKSTAISRVRIALSVPKFAKPVPKVSDWPWPPQQETSRFHQPWFGWAESHEDNNSGNV